jgi:hypothetical protein
VPQSETGPEAAVRELAVDEPSDAVPGGHAFPGAAGEEGSGTPSDGITQSRGSADCSDYSDFKCRRDAHFERASATRRERAAAGVRGGPRKMSDTCFVVQVTHFVGVHHARHRAFGPMRSPSPDAYGGETSTFDISNLSKPMLDI